LAELMIALAIFTVVMTSAGVSYIMGLKAYRAAAAESDAAIAANTAIAHVAYGVGDNCGLRAAFKPVSALSGNNGWSITFGVPKGLSGSDFQVNKIKYDKSLKQILFKADSGNWTVIGENIEDSSIYASESSVRISVTAGSAIGKTEIRNTKTTTIAFRNRG